MASQPMGLGQIGNANITFKRKYRWTFQIDTCAGSIPAYMVKLASRPNISIEETEINFLHGKMWIPGKASWETITVTFYDLHLPRSSNQGTGDQDSILNLYSWLATVYDFSNPISLYQNSVKGLDPLAVGQNTTRGNGYAGVATLNLYDGCGQTLETWTLGNVWPQSINFGELDYSSSEEVTIEVTMRYSEVKYQLNCPDGMPKPCPCPPC